MEERWITVVETFRAMGRGKSKGVRIVYYYYNKSVPVFLLTVFSKSEKSDLTQAEQRTLARLVKILRDSYRSLEG
jgi:hypothetical protein